MIGCKVKKTLERFARGLFAPHARQNLRRTCVKDVIQKIEDLAARRHGPDFCLG